MKIDGPSIANSRAQLDLGPLGETLGKQAPGPAPIDGRDVARKMRGDIAQDNTLAAALGGSNSYAEPGKGTWTGVDLSAYAAGIGPAPAPAAPQPPTVPPELAGLTFRPGRRGAVDPALLQREVSSASSKPAAAAEAPAPPLAPHFAKKLFKMQQSKTARIAAGLIASGKTPEEAHAIATAQRKERKRHKKKGLDGALRSLAETVTGLPGTLLGLPAQALRNPLGLLGGLVGGPAGALVGALAGGRKPDLAAGAAPDQPLAPAGHAAIAKGLNGLFGR
ncbi:MAG: hypothetical protein HYV63_01865 [Candidatus Schekmanbacteria bacterium]|nr:hypothetical protein [Candidatus Schekmanbacteria bacterium]